MDLLNITTLEGVVVEPAVSMVFGTKTRVSVIMLFQDYFGKEFLFRVVAATPWITTQLQEIEEGHILAFTGRVFVSNNGKDPYLILYADNSRIWDSTKEYGLSRLEGVQIVKDLKEGKLKLPWD